MLEFARWKYLLVAVVLLLAALFALPNIFGEEPALQVARKDRAAMDASAQSRVSALLRAQHIITTRSYVDTGRLMVAFGGVAEQLKARDAVNDSFKDEYITALSFAPRAPAWLRAIGLRPMPLGLDLRGGLYLLYQVNTDGAIDRLLGVYEADTRRALEKAQLNFSDIQPLTTEGATRTNGLRVLLGAGADEAKVRDEIKRALPDLTLTASDQPTGRVIDAVMTPTLIKQRQDFAIEQNLTTLRNRVNELGVSEPIVQRQGLDRISVQLPGVQNSAEVKDVLGKVATLEFRLVDITNSVADAVSRGRAPLGSKLYYNRDKQPVLLKRDIIVTGDQLVDSAVAATQTGPGVSVKLDSAGGDEMLRTTRTNLKKPMAVVFIEKRQEIVDVGGQKVTREVTDEKVINVATIQGVFSNNFQITGLMQAEAGELSLLLRAGALAAPIYIVQEQAVGPAVGQENIRQGVTALVIGMAILFVFMLVYYKTFGLVADLVLLSNVVLLAALLTVFKAALSLPGIAGMVLTVGMAVDANVLIFERIREELRNGVSPQMAITKGFENALSSIVDSNVTTLIAGVVLWMFGTGAIRGFAVVLCFGIATSLFTALLGSRALLTLMYGGARKPAKLSI